MWNKAAIFLACVLIYFYKRSVQSERSPFRFYFKFIFYYFAVLVIAAISWPFLLFRPKNVENIKLLIPALKLVSRALNLSWEIRNEEIISADHGAVIVSNHQSSLDMLGQIQVWDKAGKMTIIAKKELFYLWPFGLTAYLTGIVFINRRKTKEAYKTLFAASDVMTQDKTKIWIFPEGTRNSKREFLPFKKGAFNLAVASQVPIIPVVFSPYHFLDVEKKIFDDGRVIIQCLDEISTKGMTQEDIPTLMDNVRNKMAATYKQLTKEVLNETNSSLEKHYT